MRDEDSHVRSAATWALGKIGDPRAVDDLITALRDEDSDVRCAAALVLDEIGGPRAVDDLITALRDEDSHVRFAATWALGKIGDPRAVDDLITALRDKDLNVRVIAAWALDQLHWKPETIDQKVWYAVAQEGKAGDKMKSALETPGVWPQLRMALKDGHFNADDKDVLRSLLFLTADFVNDSSSEGLMAQVLKRLEIGGITPKSLTKENIPEDISRAVMEQFLQELRLFKELPRDYTAVAKDEVIQYIRTPDKAKGGLRRVHLNGPLVDAWLKEGWFKKTRKQQIEAIKAYMEDINKRRLEDMIKDLEAQGLFGRQDNPRGKGPASSPVKDIEKLRKLIHEKYGGQPKIQAAALAMLEALEKGNLAAGKDGSG